MASPFPGIDPFLESQDLWPDFRARFIPALCDAISERLPVPYVARIDERQGVVEDPGGEPLPGPLKLLDEVCEIYIKVLHWPDRKLVTVLELLSPSNTAGNGRRDYLAKRNALIRQEVNLVELDLLAAGRRLPMEEPLPPGDYYAFVARGDRRPVCQVYAWTVRDQLPPIPVPLMAPDRDVVIDRASVFAGVYERARYARSIDYAAPLEIPLKPEDKQWAEALAC
jgi:hypothetical protein